MSAAARAGSTASALAALLGETQVGVDKDGILIASTVTDPSGAPRKWREVGPWLWQEVNGTDKLQAMPDGEWRGEDVLDHALCADHRVPARRRHRSMPAGSFRWRVSHRSIILIAALGWPIVALVRRRYKYASDVSGRPLQLHRATRVTAWLFIALVVGWLLVLTRQQRSDGAQRRARYLDAAAAADPHRRHRRNAGRDLERLDRCRESPGQASASRRSGQSSIALAAAFLVWLCLDAGAADRVA